MKLTTLLVLLMPSLALAEPVTLSSDLVKKYDNETNMQWDPDDGLPTARLYNRAGFVSIYAHLGTPPQSVELLVDTGSDITWVNSPDNDFCVKEKRTPCPQLTRPDTHQKSSSIKSKHSLLCERYGFFDAKKSETSHHDKSFKDGLMMRYMDTTIVNGKHYLDNVTIGSFLTVDSFPFGLATEANSSMGVFALAPPSYEKDKGGNIKYKTKHFVRELQKSGQIDRAVFSMWLGDDSTDHGNVQFGAIDKAKFSGDLLTLKLVQDKSNPTGPQTKYEVLISNIFLDKVGRKTETMDIFDMSESFGQEFTTAIVDSGSKLSYLPEDIFNTLMEQIDGAFEIESGKFVIQRDAGSDEKNVTEDQLRFKFGKSTVKVPLQKFLTKYIFMTKEELHDAYGSRLNGEKDYYIIGFGKSMGIHSTGLILGQNFMRNFYIVFDLDRMELSLAPAINTPKSHFKRLGRADSVGGKLDGIPKEALDKYMLPQLYDVSRDFVFDTNGGFYINGETNDGNSLPLGSLWLLMMVLSLVYVF